MSIARRKPRPSRLARTSPLTATLVRTLSGAGSGGLFGWFVSLFVAQRWGTGGGHDAATLVSIFGSRLLGGAVAGTWMALMLPRMRTRTAAVGVGVGTVALYVAVTWACGGNWLALPFALAAGPVVGAFAGLLARAESPHVVPLEGPAPAPVGAAAERLSAWLARVAERMEEQRRAEHAPPSAAFPDRWAGILSRNVPLYGRLGAEERGVLHAMVADFLRNKRFEGAGGQEIDDEVRVTVAAQACMLGLGFGGGRDPYLDLRSVVVYPTGYSAARTGAFRFGEVDSDDAEGRLGESWGHGAVVLSWEDVLKGAADPADGRNLVFHEFAHQLDQQSGAADGVPSMATLGGARTWARLLHAELERLRERVDHGEPDVLRPYGATNEAEFFAVATETFFELPDVLRAEHPELHAALRTLYGFDPETLRPVGEG